MKRFLGIAIVSVMLVSGLAAQGPDQVIVDLPHEVIVQEQVLKPGEYTIREQESGSPILLIRGEEGEYKTNAMTFDVLERDIPSETKVVLQRIGKDYYMDKIFIEGQTYGWEVVLPDRVRERQQEMEESTVAGRYERGQQQSMEASNQAESAAQTTERSAESAAETTERSAESAAETTERGAESAAENVERGAESVAGAAEQGAESAAETVERGAESAAGAVEEGAERTAGAVERGAESAAGTVEREAEQAGVNDRDQADFAAEDRTMAQAGQQQVDEDFALPQTASPLPLAALLGFGFLASGIAARRRRK